VANILRDVITFVMAIPTAVGEFLGSLARPTPLTEPSAPAPVSSVSAARSSQTPATDTTYDSTPRLALATPSSNDDVRNTGANTIPKKSKDVVAAEDSTTTATANPQDEAKSVRSETGQTDRSSAVDRAPDAHQAAAQDPPRKHDAANGANGHEDDPTPTKQGDSVR